MDNAISARQGEAMKLPVERRLAAILAADVASYSRLVGANLHRTAGQRRGCAKASLGLFNPEAGLAVDSQYFEQAKIAG
jgi:hypothetical protein